MWGVYESLNFLDIFQNDTDPVAFVTVVSSYKNWPVYP